MLSSIPAMVGETCYGSPCHGMLGTHGNMQRPSAGLAENLSWQDLPTQDPFKGISAMYSLTLHYPMKMGEIPTVIGINSKNEG